MDNASNKFIRMTTEPVNKLVCRLAVPTIISMLVTSLYNIADTFFIGMTNDPYKVAAASVVTMLFFILHSLANLFGVGGGSLLIIWLVVRLSCSIIKIHGAFPVRSRIVHGIHLLTLKSIIVH